MQFMFLGSSNGSLLIPNVNDWPKALLIANYRMSRVVASRALEVRKNQGFYNTRMPNSLALFWTRVFSRPVQFGQTTLNSDVIMLYDIHQILELKSPKRQLHSGRSGKF